MYKFINMNNRDAKFQENVTKAVKVLSDTNKSKELSGKEKAKIALDKIREELKQPNIVGYLTTGEGGINEPFMWAEDDRYLNSNLFGEYDDIGTVFLYKFNKSPFDDVTTYFGHRLHYYDIRFSPIGKYEKFKDKVKTLDVYTDEGILKYKLAMVVSVNRMWYDNFVTWTAEGLAEFWKSVEQNGTIYDKFEEYNPDKKYAILSTCNDSDAINSAVAIYELVEFEK